MPYNKETGNIDTTLNSRTAEAFLNFLKQYADEFEQFCIANDCASDFASWVDDILDSRLMMLGVDISKYASRGDAIDAFKELWNSLRGIE